MAEAECHSFLASALDMSGYHHALVALSLSKQSLVTINKMLGGPLDRSGHLGEETDLSLMLVIESTRHLCHTNVRVMICAGKCYLTTTNIRDMCVTM